jgi:hypothetical protein
MLRADCFTVAQVAVQKPRIGLRRDTVNSRSGKNARLALAAMWPFFETVTGWPGFVYDIGRVAGQIPDFADSVRRLF